MYKLLKNATLINEGKAFESDILINNNIIEKIAKDISHTTAQIFDLTGKYILPGIIDDQVHFREPGLTHKANIYTEAKAAVAGGITSFMEMPNTQPQTLTQELLEDKYNIASKTSLANYSFFMGASNDNIEEVLKTNKQNVCGVKIFMGSSTGNMLVDNEQTLNNIFSKCDMLIATHCEDEEIIKANIKKYKDIYGEDVPVNLHPIIRSHEACYKSSSMAVELARKHNARLHILHISTANEIELFSNLPLEEKRITAEACIHHLWFNDSFYNEKGMFIKWNPAVKTEHDQKAILQALKDGKIDIIATDHAPHTLEEKNNTYFKAPSGGPLVQHALVTMLEMYHQKKVTLPFIVEKMCHNVVKCFQIEKRGYLREGYFADITVVDLNNSWEVSKSNVLYKCGWSPFEGTTFNSKVEKTFVNGNLVFDKGNFHEQHKGQRLTFDR